MQSYIAFADSDGTRTLIEVERIDAATPDGAQVKAGLADRVSDVVQVATMSLQDAMAAAIKSCAKALYCGIQTLEQRPTDAEMTFTLNATGELGNVAIGKAGGTANFTVKLSWKQPPNDHQSG